VILRASSVDDLVHRDEVKELVQARNGHLHEIVGPRENVRLDAAVLRKLVTNLRNCDVFVCGPTGFSQASPTHFCNSGSTRTESIKRRLPSRRLEIRT